MTGEAIKQRAGQSFGTQDAGPLIKRQIRGHQRGAIFVAPAEA